MTLNLKSQSLLWESIHIHKTTQSNKGYNRSLCLATALSIPNLRVTILTCKTDNRLLVKNYDGYRLYLEVPIYEKGI